MGWIRDFLSSTGNSTDVQSRHDERFPSHTYGTGYPIVVRHEELNDLARLLEMEREAPDGWDKTPFLSKDQFEDVVNDAVGHIDGELPSPEKRRGEIHEILRLWQEQLIGTEDAVWTTIGTDYQFKFYIQHCEIRADSEEDDFEEPDELDTAREILTRIETAQGTDSKLAVVHKRDLPLEEPEEDSSETN